LRDDISANVEGKQLPFPIRIGAQRVRIVNKYNFASIARDLYSAKARCLPRAVLHQGFKGHTRPATTTSYTAAISTAGEAIFVVTSS
jgi:hypothetical protein